MDFKKATSCLPIQSSNGEPVVIYQPKPGSSPLPPDEGGDDGQKRIKYVVNDVPVKVVAERVQYYDKQGKLITESLKDYTRNTVRKEFASLHSFLTRWSKAEKKELIIQELEGQGLCFMLWGKKLEKTLILLILYAMWFMINRPYPKERAASCSKEELLFRVWREGALCS